VQSPQSDKKRNVTFVILEEIHLNTRLSLDPPETEKKTMVVANLACAGVFY
jgi:hypothetical protein